MTYKSISDKDPFPVECPNARELTKRQLKAFLEDAEHANLTTWEEGFCDSLLDRLEFGVMPSDGQYDVLNKGLLKKLWDADPELWKMNGD